MPQMIPFRNRGGDVTRVEAFSDVVFGFALTLIVVSLEVPTTFAALTDILRGFPAFAICFAMLTWVWYVHHVFFRRYGLTDDITIALNAVLLFVVLFYTYPLKFMFSIVTGQIRRGSGDAATLFVIYGLGFAGIFALFVAMYAWAWRKRDALALNDVERHDTRTAMIMLAGQGSIGVVSALIAMSVTGYALNYAGWVYFLIGPVSAFIGFWRGSRRPRGETVTATAATSELPT
jgi:uncharacterized membrane protein